MPAGSHHNRPSGGMFLWATVDGIDTTELLKVSAKEKVVFVPGVSFYPERDVHDGMRLNFSNASEEKFGKASAVLAPQYAPSNLSSLQR